MVNKTRIEFDGFEEVIARFTELEGDIKGTTEKALEKTHEFITKNAESAIARHHRTGATEKSLVRNAKVQWAGTLATVETGFDISNGGLPSIFLMYGTPRMAKDQNLYNAFFGGKTKNEVMKIQEEIFYDEIRRLDS